MTMEVKLSIVSSAVLLPTVAAVRLDVSFGVIEGEDIVACMAVGVASLVTVLLFISLSLRSVLDEISVFKVAAAVPENEK